MHGIMTSESNIKGLGRMTVRRGLFPSIKCQLNLRLYRLHLNRSRGIREATDPTNRDAHRPARKRHFHGTASNRTLHGLSMNTHLPCSPVDKTEWEMLNEEKMRKCFILIYE
jgi:hypothetical protein